MTGGKPERALSGRWHLPERPLRILLALVALLVAAMPLFSSTSRPLVTQPFPDAPTYADTAFLISNGVGFGTRVDERLTPEQDSASNVVRPSRYPPGFPLFLSPFVRLANNEVTDAAGGARAAALLLLFSVFLAAFALGGPLAAAIAALVVWSSPFTRQSSAVLMSDAYGASIALLVLACLTFAWSTVRDERLRQFLMGVAGFLSGYALLVRITAVAMLGALLVSARRRFVRAVALGALPCLIFLGTFQWTEFGSPLRSGYDFYLPTLRPIAAEYVLSPDLLNERGYIFEDRLDGRFMPWTCPCDAGGPVGTSNNLIFYPAVLLGLVWVFAPPLFPVLGIWELVRRRRQQSAQFAMATIAWYFVFFVPYFYQGARLMAPAAFMLLAFAAARAAQLLESWTAIVAKRLRPARDRISKRDPEQLGPELQTILTQSYQT